MLPVLYLGIMKAQNTQQDMIKLFELIDNREFEKARIRAEIKASADRQLLDTILKFHVS